MDVLPGERNLGLDVAAIGGHQQIVNPGPARGAILGVFRKP
jgi:hypothetical protein